jgi:hypothetical protein
MPAAGEFPTLNGAIPGNAVAPDFAAFRCRISKALALFGRAGAEREAGPRPDGGVIH